MDVPLGNELPLIQPISIMPPPPEPRPAQQSAYIRDVTWPDQTTDRLELVPRKTGEAGYYADAGYAGGLKLETFGPYGTSDEAMKEGKEWLDRYIGDVSIEQRHDQRQQKKDQAIQAAWSDVTREELEQAGIDSRHYGRNDLPLVLGRDEEGRLHRDPSEGPALTIRSTNNDDVSNAHTDIYIVHGDLVALADFTKAGDEEGTSYAEHWYDPQGKLHSFQGKPAVVEYSNHYIPEETWMDESKREFWNHGTLTEAVDATYDDIIATKPLTVRQAFGYDLEDNPARTSPAPDADSGAATQLALELGEPATKTAQGPDAQQTDIPVKVEAPRAGSAGDPASPSRTAGSETPERPETPAVPDGKSKPAATETDPMRELLDRMERLARMMAAADPALAGTLQNLSQRGADPDQRSQPGFRHDVAYALQDVEQSIGRLDLPAPLRTEMTQLAGTAVGLNNERMQALMAATATIQDRALVLEIRDAGKEIGRRADQSRPDIESQIDVLQNRARLTIRPAAPEANARSSGARGPDGDGRPPEAPPAGPRNDHNGPGSGAAGPPVGTRPANIPNADVSRNAGYNQGQVAVQHSVLDTLLRAMRPNANQAQPPWEPPATPVADRIAANDRRVQMQADDRSLASAEQRGQAALDALQGFNHGAGAAVMNKIREAAKTEPGGMPAVLSEMREGGRFADLRKEFGNALSNDAGFATAYDKAAGALAAYGKTRTDIEPILARRPDATAFTRRLTEMDAEIGQAAAATPGKTEGRSMMADLTKQAAELLQRAVDAIKAAFSRSPSPEASASPSPGP